MTPDRLLALWHRLDGSAAGRWLFSQAMRFAVPYTGALGSRVQLLAPGRAVVTLADRRAVRNHLGSIHAIALANLAEFASGLAMLAALDDQTRGIVTGITIRYHKKARGVLTATGSAEPPVVTEPVEALARAGIADASGELVAEVEVTWRLAPRTP